MLSKGKFKFTDIMNNLDFFESNTIHLSKRLRILEEIHNESENSNDFDYDLYLFGTLGDLSLLEISLTLRYAFGDTISTSLRYIESVGSKEIDRGYFFQVNGVIMERTPLVLRCDCGDKSNLTENLRYVRNESTKLFDDHYRVCLILHEKVKDLRLFDQNLKPTMVN